MIRLNTAAHREERELMQDREGESAKIGFAD